jgi:hypothetical protein
MEKMNSLRPRKTSTKKGKNQMPQKRGTPRISARQAMVAANRHLLFHYPTMFTGATPRRLRLPNLDLWVVPIVLTHPVKGVVGQVGLVAVDASSGEVMGSTPRPEAVASAKKIRGAKGYELETAILRPRAV